MPFPNSDYRFRDYWDRMARDDYMALRHQRFGSRDPRSGCDTMRAEILASNFGQQGEADRQRRRCDQNIDRLRRKLGSGGEGR